MKEDIIRMAREARGYPAAPTDGSLWLFSESHLERFANLVAAAEREECAKVAENMLRFYTQAVTGVPQAIRGRGQE